MCEQEWITPISYDCSVTDSCRISLAFQRTKCGGKKTTRTHLRRREKATAWGSRLTHNERSTLWAPLCQYAFTAVPSHCEAFLLLLNAYNEIKCLHIFREGRCSETDSIGFVCLHRYSIYYSAVLTEHLCRFVKYTFHIIRHFDIITFYLQ